MSTPSFLNGQPNDLFALHRSVIEGKWPDLHVVEAIGAGGFGSVYRCVKREEGIEEVEAQRAVKVIDLRQPGDESEMRRRGQTAPEFYEARAKSCKAEIDNMERLESPHIVEIKNFARVSKPDHPSSYFLIQMALYHSLKDHLAEHLEDSQAEAEAMAKKLGMDICDALESCRAKGKVHQDIKPGNIFVSDSGNFYLGDFGLARSMRASVRVTTGGSEGYMPPEAYANRRPDHRGDIYSLGLVLYEVLNHGRLPFLPAYPSPYDWEDEQEAGYCLLDQSMEKPAPDNCSAAFAQVVLKACCWDINGRYQTAAEFSNALQALTPGQKNKPKTRPKAPSVKQMLSQKNTPKAQPQTPPANQLSAPSQSSPISKPSAPNPQKAAAQQRPASKPFTRLDEPPIQPPPESPSRDEWQRTKETERKRTRRRRIGILAAVVGIWIMWGLFVTFAGDGNPKRAIDNAASGIVSFMQNLAQKAGTEKPGDGSVSLFDMTMVDGSGAEIQEQVTNSLGHVLDEALVLDSWGDSAFARYNVDEYDRLTGVYSCPDEGMGNSDQCRLTIYLDDQTDDPLVDTVMFRSVSETPFDLDVSGAQFVTFRIDPGGGGYITTNRAALSSCRLYKGQRPQPQPSSPVPAPNSGESDGGDAAVEEKLTSMHIVQSNGGEVRRDVMNSLGQTYDRAIYLDAWGESAFIRYYVADYTHISGAYSCPDDYGDSEQCRLIIYLDDQIDNPILEDTIFRSIAVTPFELDLNGAQFITFRLYPTEGGIITSASAMFTDCVVSK